MDEHREELHMHEHETLRLSERNAHHHSFLPLNKRWVLHFYPALCRLHRYMGYCIEDTQISESVSTSGSAISKAASTGGGHLFPFFTLVLSLSFFFWSTLLLSPAELISWKWEDECPLLSHSAPGGPDWPLSVAPDTVPTWFSRPLTSQSPLCLCWPDAQQERAGSCGGVPVRTKRGG